MGRARSAHDYVGRAGKAGLVRSVQSEPRIAALLGAVRASLSVLFLATSVLLCVPSSSCLLPDQYTCVGGYRCSDLTVDKCDFHEGCSIGLVCAPLRCSAHKDEAECGDARDCEWTADASRCDFKSSPCFHLPADECNADKACTWEDGCTGPFIRCDKFTTSEACWKHAACSWGRLPNLH